MKHLLLALLLACFSSAFAADTPAKIAEDYRKQSAAALVKVNGMLETATTPLIARLIQLGDTAGAEQLTTQLKAKLAGEPVVTPQASAVLLFAQYDQARTKALEPVQKASIARIDTLLTTGGRTKLETVTELGKVRAEIEVGKAVSAPSDIPMSWDYYVGTRLVGLLLLKADGTLSLQNVNPDGTLYMTGNPKKPVTTDGLWERSKANVLKITLTPPGEPEKCEMIISGKNAVLKRAIGDRPLIAK